MILIGRKNFIKQITIITDKSSPPTSTWPLRREMLSSLLGADVRSTSTPCRSFTTSSRRKPASLRAAWYSFLSQTCWDSSKEVNWATAVKLRDKLWWSFSKSSRLRQRSMKIAWRNLKFRKWKLSTIKNRFMYVWWGIINVGPYYSMFISLHRRA